MTDEAIIEMYFERNEDAIAETEKQYGAYCLAIAENILPSGEDAKECVNDTWMRAWNSIPPNRPNSLKLFLARITRNLSYNKARASTAIKRRGELYAVLDELDGCISRERAESRVEMSELTRSINNFLATLETRERSIFVRRYFFVEQTVVIARRYNTTSANVFTVLSRTRKKLKRHLQKEGYMI